VPDEATQTIEPAGSSKLIQKPQKEKPILKPRSEPPIKIKDVDLQTTITDDLCKGSYECMICLHTLGKSAQIWACQTCYGLFHLSCVRKWAESCLKTESDGRQSWRCPGCQEPSTDPIPDSYYCFCGKTLDPQYSKVGTPHSCSQPCSKPRSCPHRCS
jgi:transcriptional repressor NF-X1